MEKGENYNIHSIKDFHIFELLINLTEAFGLESEISSITYLITEEEIEPIKTKREKSLQLKCTLIVNRSSPKPIRVRIRNFLNVILKFYTHFISEVPIFWVKMDWNIIGIISLTTTLARTNKFFL